MSIPDWELWACANELVQQHGRAAVLKSGERVIQLEAEGDEAGAMAWRLINMRVIELLRKPGEDETRQ